MKELIERIECATGSTRELDALILIVTLEATSAKFGLNNTFEAVQSTVDGDSWSVVTFVDGKKADRQSPPPFTASLDAAMTLVPEGWNWMAGERDQGRCRAYVNNGEPQFADIGASRRNPKAIWHEVVAASPALALVAAALKARTAAKDR